MIRVGEILQGTYLIQKEIGQGGVGVIYLAEHLNLRKKVVIKKIKDSVSSQVKNMRAEVDILKKLHHNYLPQVYDYVTVKGAAYTVIEYIEGKDLQWYLDKNYTFPEEIVYKWMLQMAQVLEYLHSRKPIILHSDIKPANIMITPSQDICLIDFNISLDGDNAGDVQGLSPLYAAPEQYQKALSIQNGTPNNNVMDEKMDIYSTGMVFYRLMTGYKVSHFQQPLPDIRDFSIPYSDALKEVVRKCTQEKMSKRYKSASQLLDVLNDIGKTDPQYKRLTNLQIITAFLYVISLVIGGTMFFSGTWIKKEDSFQQLYQTLCQTYETGNDTQVINEGISLLNDSSLQSYLKKNEDNKATVLHLVGDGYYNKEDYYSASSMYKEAYELSPNEEKYCLDYVISLIQCGSLTEAERVMSQSSLTGANTMLVEASLDYKKGDSVSALNKLASILNGSVYANDNVYEKSCILASQLYEEQNEMDNAVSLLLTTGTKTSNKSILRKAGQLSMQQASVSGRGNSKAYYQDAYNVYANLIQYSNPSYEDQLNYAICAHALGKYNDSNTILKKMAMNYSEDYLIPMWQCYNYYYLYKSGNDTWNDLKFQYNSAKSKYNQSSEKNEDMEDLIITMTKLGL